MISKYYIEAFRHYFVVYNRNFTVDQDGKQHLSCGLFNTCEEAQEQIRKWDDGTWLAELTA